MWCRKMRDDERVKCGNVEVEKGNDNLEAKAKAQRVTR
jgi:hypothetical protein